MTSPVAPRRRYLRIGNASTAIPLRGGGSAIAAGLAPGPDTMQFDPYLYPPPFSTPINVSVNTAITGAGAIFRPAGSSFQAPLNSYAVISTIDLLLDGILPTSNVLWTFLINGTPVPGLSPLTILGRSGAASVSKSWQGPLRIAIPLNGIFSVLITDVDGAPYTAGTAYSGWFFPQSR